MHKQLLIPGFPDGAQRIGESVSIVEKDGWVSYFVGGDDYFKHTKEDLRSRRFILTALMENKHLKGCDLSGPPLLIPHRTLIEFTRENNPFEAELGKFCTLDGSTDFLGREALRKVAREGHQREMRGVLFDGGACPPCGKPWPVLAGDADGPQIGQITSAAWSPRLQRNVGLSMIERAFWEPG